MTGLSSDSGFVPAIHAFEQYRERCAEAPSETLVIWLLDPEGKGSRFEMQVLVDPRGPAFAATERVVERVVKFLLWQRGGSRLVFSGRPDLADSIRRAYCPGGPRALDEQLVVRDVHGESLSVEVGEARGDWKRRGVMRDAAAIPRGCRIGFDLGGSDRKCAAVIDGEVVHSEEVEWSPYHQTDPDYHIAGIRDSIRRAARHLPRIDAIGGSSAGIFVDSVPRVASLFRGLSASEFTNRVQPFFRGLSQEWGVPVVILNDGEASALAGARATGKRSVLGVSMGTSMAAGHVDPEDGIGAWLNELAFAPVDFGPEAAVDEWSGDVGCGVQYFSQQAVIRLAERAGIDLARSATAAEKLKQLQEWAAAGDLRALRLFDTIGEFLGFSLPWFQRFLSFEAVLLLGRVMSGVGGERIREQALELMRERFPSDAERISLHIPDERFRRHGQAIVAAWLPQ